jgi:hypothetical protein
VNQDVNRQWVLAARPEGQVQPSHFDFREGPVPEIGDGEFLARNLYLSLDPAMRTWMTEARSYIPPVGLGEVMRGMCTAQVLESRNPEFAAGDLVVGLFGWQDHDADCVFRPEGNRQAAGGRDGRGLRRRRRDRIRRRAADAPVGVSHHRHRRWRREVRMAHR